jgi:hypothetical protein
VGHLSALLDMGQLVVLAADGIYERHDDRPFLNLPGDCDEVNVELVVVAESWPNPTRHIRWKEIEKVPASDSVYTHLLRCAVLASDEEEGHQGVRAQGRVEEEVSYVVDGAHVFVPLSRNFDVWFAYWGGLTIDGVAVEPRSIWLHADLHTALQPVVLGQNFTLPIVAAQYTAAHLRFELDPLVLMTGPFRVAFDVSVGMAFSPWRKDLAKSEHVSRTGMGWALSGGAVAWAGEAPCFLHMDVAVFGKKDFEVPAPSYSHHYALVPSSDGRNRARFIEEGLLPVSEGHDDYQTREFFRRLLLERTEHAAEDEPWRFELRARLYRFPGGQLSLPSTQTQGR